MPQSAAELTLRPHSRIVAVVGTTGVGELIGTRRTLTRGWLAYTKSRCRQAFICDPDAHVFGHAVANETSTQFRARFEAPGGILSVLRAQKPGVVVLDAFRDDVVAGVSLAEMTANLDAFISAIIGIGAVCVVRTPTPRGASNQVAARFTAAQLLQTIQFIRAIMTRRDTKGVLVADTWQAVALRDSLLGEAGFNYTRDGINGNARFGHSDSLIMTEIFRFLYPTRFVSMIPSGGDIWDAVNNPSGSFVRNPFVTGSNNQPGTDNTGLLPDNWFGNQTGNGIILTFSKVTTTSFNGQDYTDEKSKNWMQIVVSGTAANVNLVCAAFQNIDPTLLAIGDICHVRAEYEIESAVNLARITFGLYDTQGGSANAATQLAADWDGQTETDTVPLPFDTIKEAGIWRTPSAVGLAGVNNKQVQLRLKAANAGQAVSATIRIRAVDGRKITA